MLVYRSMRHQNPRKSPTPYRSSRPTLHASSSSPCHPDPPPPATSSSVHVGTSYEHLCARTLPRLGFRQLARTGGRADKGIDLLAKWLPGSSRDGGTPPPLNAVVQCKAVARKPGPEMIRGLEGALAGAPGEWRGADTVGVLCARRQVTPGVRDALRRSNRGVVWVMVEDCGGATDEGERGGEEVVKGDGESEGGWEAGQGRIKQVLWNDRVQELLGEGAGTGVMHTPGADGGPMEAEVLMSWNGILAVPD